MRTGDSSDSSVLPFIVHFRALVRESQDLNLKPDADFLAVGARASQLSLFLFSTTGFH